jgi:hypothetical protein
MNAYSVLLALACTQKPCPETSVTTWPTPSSTGPAAPVQMDWPGASTVMSTLSVFAPAVAITYVPAPRRSTCTRPDASMLINVGSRGTRVGGAATLPNRSSPRAVSRTVSTFTRSRGFCGVIVIDATAPAVPVAVK